MRKRGKKRLWDGAKTKKGDPGTGGRGPDLSLESQNVVRENEKGDPSPPPPPLDSDLGTGTPHLTQKWENIMRKRGKNMTEDGDPTFV